MAFYENILGFLTDRTQRIPTRATIFVLSVFIIILADNIIGFSHYYNKTRQLDQLEKVTTLLKDSTLNPTVRKDLTVLQQESLNRKTFIDYCNDFLNKIVDSNPKKSVIRNGVQRNEYWFIVSTSGIYIIITVLLVPVLLLTARTIPFLQLITMLLIFVTVMFFTSWFNYWLFDKIIPDELFGSWTWNYVINILLQILLFFGLYWTTQRIESINKSLKN